MFAGSYLLVFTMLGIGLADYAGIIVSIIRVSYRTLGKGGFPPPPRIMA